MQLFSSGNDYWNEWLGSGKSLDYKDLMNVCGVIVNLLAINGVSRNRAVPMSGMSTIDVYCIDNIQTEGYLLLINMRNYLYS